MMTASDHSLTVSGEDWEGAVSAMTLDEGVGGVSAVSVAGIGERGGDGWVYVSKDAARSHPLFGIHGWALILAAALACGPIVLVWQSTSILTSIYGHPSDTWLVIAADATVLMFAWATVHALAVESGAFHIRLFFTTLLALCGGLLFLGTFWAALPVGYGHVFWWGVVMRLGIPVVLAIYVLRSDRVNVTTRFRVRPDDPWLTELWTGRRPEADTGLLARLIRRFGFDGDEPVVSATDPIPEGSHAYVIDPYYTAGGGFEPEHVVLPRADARNDEPMAMDVEPAGPPEGGWGEAARAAAPTVADARSGSDADASADDATLERLRRLRRAYDEGLISTDELEATRRRIIAEL